MQSPSTVDFWAEENKICHCFHFFPFHLPWSGGARCHDLSFFFLMLSFKPALSLFCFTYIKRLFSSTSLSAIRVENILVTVNLRFSGYNTKVQMIKEKKISKLFLLKVLKIFCYSKISQKMKRSSKSSQNYLKTFYLIYTELS